ncbi:MAG TPA: SulP family inorganic anion transporter, partial [Pirellulaceae bacterium]
ELTIKGPAAGLIVIILGAVTDFGFTGGKDAAADFQAYRMMLAVGCAAAVIQIAFGWLRAGRLGDFFPTAVVHGMLAAIGLIIMLKKLPEVVGQTAAGEPLKILLDLPDKLRQWNPEITVIGVGSLLILFGLPLLKRWFPARWFQLLPAPILVVLFAIPLGIWLHLEPHHTYSFLGHTYKADERFLVTVPSHLLDAVTTPEWRALSQPKAWKWVLMFTLIGTLESLLSAKAIDMIDPWRRKTNLNRDLMAVGCANLLATSIGGLPMISEIVRSKANIDNGARTRFADLWHGVFLLAFVALLPGLIHRIPLAALAAMLVYTGFRLASPREFINVFRTGREQLVIFVSTIVGVLATDLLLGILIGIVVKFLIHAWNGVPLRNLFKPYLEIERLGDQSVIINARGSAVFSNWLPFKRQIEQLGLEQGNNITINMEGTQFVDHTVMEKLHEMESDFERAHLKLEVVGLDEHQPFADHPHAARRRPVLV